MDNFFSKNIKYLRSREGLSLVDLADKIGISKSVLNQYENGRTQPTLPILQNIVHYFGYSMDDITERDLQSTPVVREPEAQYEKKELDELKKLRIENNALREALREIGKGIKN